MSMQNYGVSGYGFQTMRIDDERFEEIMDFIERYMEKDVREIFSDCECLEDVELRCEELDPFEEPDIAQILAMAIDRESKIDVRYCRDDYGEPWIMMLSGDSSKIRRFEKVAGKIAKEFYGKDVEFDFHETTRFA